MGSELVQRPLLVWVWVHQLGGVAQRTQHSSGSYIARPRRMDMGSMDVPVLQAGLLAALAEGAEAVALGEGN